ncbi:MAG: hypothetical protein ACOX5G_01005 [Kiritimatiellia bacterium]|jgi:hypothetical protein
MKIDRFLPALVAVTVSLAIGCARKADYKPLIPQGTVLASVSHDRQFRDNPVLQGIRQASDELQKKQYDELWTEWGENAPLTPELARVLSMNSPQLIQYLCGENADIEWMLLTVGASGLLNNDDDSFSVPPAALVICLNQPLDLADPLAKIRKLAEDQWNSLDEQDKTFEEALENFFQEMEWESGIRISETTYQERTALRVTIKDSEIEGNIEGLSPILATIGDGRLIALAVNERHLDELSELYAGRLPALDATTPLAKEMALPNDVYSRAAIADIPRVMRKFLSASQWENFTEAMEEDEEIGPYILSTQTLRLDVALDSASMSMVFRVEVDMDSEDRASSLGYLAQAGKSALSMGAQMLSAQNRELAFLADWVGNLDCGNRGKTTFATFSFTSDDIRKLDDVRQLYPSIFEDAF